MHPMNNLLSFIVCDGQPSETEDDEPLCFSLADQNYIW